MKMRVAVIGAGAAGLCAVKKLVSVGHDVICYERGSGVGGTWVFDERIGIDDHGLPVHSSMYKGLRTNLPKEIMGFPGFPFVEEEASFIKHENVLAYLVDYAKQSDLLRHVKFSHNVERVAPEGSSGWRLEVRDLQNAANVTETFDAIFVCNGHYFCPIYPAIPGYDTFKGLKMHCHDFRDPKSLKDIASLALVGAGPSGQDLAVELSKHVEKIYLVVKTGSKTKMGALPQNVVRMFDPKEFTQEGILLTSGDTVKVDAVMLCTGYHYAFPFLSPECGITVERQRISPLYKHCVHVRYPTMFFIGVVSTVLPFVLFHFQMEFCTRLLSTKGETKLPSIEEMNQDSEQELSRRLAMGWPEHYYHRMAELQWDYMDDLASLAGVESFSPVLKKLYQHVGGWRMIDLTSYKNRKYRLLNKEEFVDITGDGRVPNPGLIPPNDFRS